MQVKAGSRRPGQVILGRVRGVGRSAAQRSRTSVHPRTLDLPQRQEPQCPPQRTIPLLPCLRQRSTACDPPYSGFVPSLSRAEANSFERSHGTAERFKSPVSSLRAAATSLELKGLQTTSNGPPGRANPRACGSPSFGLTVTRAPKDGCSPNRVFEGVDGQIEAKDQLVATEVAKLLLQPERTNPLDPCEAASAGMQEPASAVHSNVSTNGSIVQQPRRSYPATSAIRLAIRLAAAFRGSLAR